MGLSISQKADTLGTFRFVLVRLMETLAAWVPTSPELEVKTLFGRHIWQLAQQADAIGNRTVELRAKLHYERPPQPAYSDALRVIQDTPRSANRVAGFYQVVLPDLAARFREYLANTDELLDAPTVEIIHRILIDFEGMERAHQEVRAQRPELKNDTAWLDGVKRALATTGDFVVSREGAVT